jgi:putative transposase
MKVLWKTILCHGHTHVFVTNKLRSCGAAMKVISHVNKQETGC